MPFLALATGIQAGTSLLGGFFQNSAAAKRAAALKQTGIDVAHSLEKATGQGIAAGYAGLDQANTALDTGYGRATDAITQGRDAATGAVAAGVGGANQALTDAYGRQIGFLSPYMTAGQTGLDQLQAFLAPGGAGTKPFTADMMSQYDPGYQFRLQQGAQALAKSAAARGGSLGGGAAKSLANYSQNLASSEYQNAWQRYTAGQQQQYQQLMGLAGIGERATALGVGAAGDYGRGVSANTMTGAGWTGNYNMAAGQGLAQAGLQVGSQKAQTAMQGNQWIGQFGLQGALDAGNAYEWGATGNAQGRNAGNNALWQGIGGAAGAIGGGLLNYWGGGGMPPSSGLVSGNVPIEMPSWAGNPLG